MSSYNLHSKEFNPISKLIQGPDTRLLPGMTVAATPFLNSSVLLPCDCYYQTSANKWRKEITLPFNLSYSLFLLNSCQCFQTHWTCHYLSDLTLRLYTCHSSLLLSFITLPNSVHCLYNPFILCTEKNSICWRLNFWYS